MFSERLILTISLLEADGISSELAEHAMMYAMIRLVVDMDF